MGVFELLMLYWMLSARGASKEEKHAVAVRIYEEIEAQNKCNQLLYGKEK
jgi:hypothetical protein